MTKKKTDEFEVAMNATVDTDEEKEDVTDAILDELSKKEVTVSAEDAPEPAPKKKRASKKKADAE